MNALVCRYVKRQYLELETRVLFSHVLVMNRHVNLRGFILSVTLVF